MTQKNSDAQTERAAVPAHQESESPQLAAVPQYTVEGPDCCRQKQRSEKEHRDLINRLSRIEGQIRGIKGMIEKDCYCTDIIVQVAAANAALNSFNKVLLAEHIRTCVADGIREGNDEKIDELVEVLQKLMK